MLTGGRLDTQAKDFVAARYSAALNSSLCPNERLELCGRLTPGQSLEMGEYITNERAGLRFAVTQHTRHR